MITIKFLPTIVSVLVLILLGKSCKRIKNVTQVSRVRCLSKSGRYRSVSEEWTVLQGPGEHFDFFKVFFCVLTQVNTSVRGKRWGLQSRRKTQPSKERTRLAKKYSYRQI